MTVRPSIFFMFSMLIAVFLSLGQVQPPQQSHLSQPPTALSDNDGLKKELLRIQMELNQIVQDMDAIDTRMMQGITNKGVSGTSQIIPKVHELLKSGSGDKTLKDFFDSHLRNIQWDSCLKTSKLYTGLFERVFEMNEGRLPGEEKNRKVSSIADESPEAVQLVFLVRMMAELEFRYSELQSQLMTNPDVKQQELWHRLRQALQNDDRAHMEKLNSLLARVGVSPHNFAAKVISAAQKTSQTAATALVEGMGIVKPEEDVWKLAEIPGINPDFIQALECDKKAMKDFLATDSSTAIAQASSCRKYVDGSYIQAFAAKRVEQAQSTDVVGKTPSTIGAPLDPDIFRLPKEDLTQELLKSKKGDPKAEGDQHQAESEGKTFGPTYKAVPKPKIPSWWIRCECPEDHPDAGMVVDGVRWHAPVLRCPDPEVKRWQVK